MKRSKLALFFCLMLVATMLVSVIACSKPAATPPATKAPSATATPPATAAPAVTPKYGGILQIFGGTSPGGGGTNFGWPATALWHIISAAQPALEMLVREDSKLNIIPWLAESWAVAPDKTSITFKLRQGVKFHDGTEFNAAAVKFNLDAVKEAKLAETTYWSSIDVVDNFTVRLNLNGWANSILPGLASYPAGMMVSPTAVQKNGKEWAMLNPVGTGPFKFVSYKQDVSLEYTKNPDYWQKGKPYLDGIKYTAVADVNAQTLGFESGQGDMTASSAVKPLADLRDWGGLLVYQPDGALALNPDAANADSPFSKKEVRQAVEYAMDRDTMAKTLGYGIFTPAYQWPRPGAVGYVEGLKREYNPAKAKELLTLAGYPNGFKCKLTIRFPEFTQAQAGYLAAMGIETEQEVVMTGGKYQEYQTKGWNKTLFCSVNPSRQNFLVSVQQWFLTPNYYPSLKKPANLQELYNAAISTLTVEPAKVEAVARAIFDDASVLVTNYQGAGHIIRKNSDGSPVVMGHGFYTLSDLTFGWTPEDCWLNKK